MSETEKKDIREIFVALRQLIESISPTREISLAVTKLDECRLWTDKALED